MKCKVLLAVSLLACLASGIAAAQNDSLAATYHLSRGVQAYKEFHYESAVEHFRQAHKFDPKSRDAALYLANGLAQLWIPGVFTAENVKLADEAIDTYKQVLVLDPQNISAFKWLGYLEFLTKRYEEAKSHYHQASQANSKDPEALYCIGVIDWVQAYKHRVDERTKRGLTGNHPATSTQSFCAKLRADNLPLIEDGIQVLKQAVELRTDFDDAMAYLSLLSHERAEIECHNKAAANEDEQQAVQWADKSVAARRQRVKKSAEPGPPPQSPEALLTGPPPALPPPPPPPPPKNQ